MAGQIAQNGLSAIDKLRRAHPGFGEPIELKQTSKRQPSHEERSHSVKGKLQETNDWVNCSLHYPEG